MSDLPIPPEFTEEDVRYLDELAKKFCAATRLSKRSKLRCEQCERPEFVSRLTSCSGCTELCCQGCVIDHDGPPACVECYLKRQGRLKLGAFATAFGAGCGFTGAMIAVCVRYGLGPLTIGLSAAGCSAILAGWNWHQGRRR